MGILKEPADFVKALQLPKGFTVCELGDQWVTHELPHRIAREFFQGLGCSRYESVDANGRGTITFDLNRKWHGKTGQFDLVTDFGTGEHVFNQAEVWRTLHVLAKPKGFIAFDHPSQGYPGHSFYRLDECLLRDIAAANAYRVLYLQTGQTTRGELVRGVFQKSGETKFTAPQQGRYKESLQV